MHGAEQADLRGALKKPIRNGAAAAKLRTPKTWQVQIRAVLRPFSIEEELT